MKIIPIKQKKTRRILSSSGQQAALQRQVRGCGWLPSGFDRCFELCISAHLQTSQIGHFQSGGNQFLHPDCQGSAGREKEDWTKEKRFHRCDGKGNKKKHFFVYVHKF